MKKLPIGIQGFAYLRSEPHYYVDKTPFVKKLVDEGKFYFLSRPRRFGKSLFLDTLRQAFLGKRELFEGLYLEDNWDWQRRYPVIYISFGAGGVENREILNKTIESILREHAGQYNIVLKEEIYSKRFYELIRKLSEKHSEQVVVLIDEYDKPILDRIDRPDVAIEIREALKNFYSVLKDADAYLKFVFITGVSKFSKVSLFSGLNNLRDITIEPEYATICGYTQGEFEEVFSDKLEGINLDDVRQWYNGYQWLGEPVYNPFDILLYLQSREFRPYWFETGTPTFLIKLLQKERYYIPDLESLEAGETLIGSFDVEKIEPETLLFQTGYLTIKGVKRRGARREYRLGYPNLEVRMSLNDHILNWYVQEAGKKERAISRLYDCLDENDFERLRDIFRSFFASIPYDWYRKNEIDRYEGYYASVFYSYFVAAGFDVTAEDITSVGRIDMTVRYRGRVYIFEFKVVEIEGEGSAFEQLKGRNYHEKYLASTEEVYLIGVDFSRKDRNIVGFKWERIPAS